MMRFSPFIAEQLLGISWSFSYRSAKAGILTRAEVLRCSLPPLLQKINTFTSRVEQQKKNSWKKLKASAVFVESKHSQILHIVL